MDYAKMITDSITMKEVFSLYGFTPNSRGFICCPIHQEKTPSLGIYQSGRKWKCFGCGEGGSVIDFIMKYFGIGFKQAVTKINYDFNLKLPLSGNISIKERRELERRERERKEKLREEARIKQQKQDRRNALLDRWAECDKIITERMRQHPEATCFYEVAQEGDWKLISDMQLIEYLLDIEEWW